MPVPGHFSATINTLPSVVLVMIYGQARMFFVMSRDGLLPERFSRIVNRRANGDRDRRSIGDRGLMRAYAVPEWRRA